MSIQEEIWKDIQGYEGRYQVSNFGRILSIWKHKKVFMIQFKHKEYMKIQLSKNNKTVSRFVHRLVLQSFCPVEDDKLQVNHKNCIKSDNRLENLEWVTASENMIHCYKNNLKEIKCPVMKLTISDVIEIRKLIKEGVADKTIARMFNVCRSNISYIRTKKIWKNSLQGV